MTSKQPDGRRSPELQALLNEAARRDAELEAGGSDPAAMWFPGGMGNESGAGDGSPVAAEDTVTVQDAPADHPAPDDSTASDHGGVGVGPDASARIEPAIGQPPVQPVAPRISSGTASSDYPVLVARAALQAADRLGEIHQPAAARPLRDRRRAFVLAGGVAAAVVAIVAVTVHGAPGTASNDAPVDRTGTAVVRSTGSDGKPSQPTVTAPMSTVGGQLVALVTNTDGSVSRLPVQTVLPRTSAAGNGITTRASANALTTKDTTKRLAPVSVLGTARTKSEGGTTTVPSTTSLVEPQETAGSAVRTGSSDAAPTPTSPSDDETATVIPGVTKLTGWIPVPTITKADVPGSEGGIPQIRVESRSTGDGPGNAVGPATTRTTTRPTGAASATTSSASTTGVATVRASSQPPTTAASTTAAPSSTASTSTVATTEDATAGTTASDPAPPTTTG